MQSLGVILVFIGAGVGGVMRYAVNLAASRIDSDFPYGTLAINVVGSILMGMLVGWFALRSESPQARLFLATGVLGGFTTFSTFSLESVSLIERGQAPAAAGYIVASVGIALGGLFVGLWVARAIL